MQNQLRRHRHFWLFSALELQEVSMTPAHEAISNML